MQAFELPQTLKDKLGELGLTDETIESLFSAYRKEHLRDPATLGDILEVVE
ncbi:hypothetical protein ACNF40_06265 [Cuniculiplasma sp. SKW4]|uniref:hypothetical protein n=1 Tax=Cuniculiplasma sp. SKW4 TaxID=3400171 RepID=UPI003FD67AE7